MLIFGLRGNRLNKRVPDYQLSVIRSSISAYNSYFRRQLKIKFCFVLYFLHIFFIIISLYVLPDGKTQCVLLR